LMAGVVTVKVASATCPPVSVARTVVPDVPEGTANRHENAPEESVVSTPLEQDEIVTPSNTSDASGAEIVNPVPATVTVAPCGPWTGVAVIAGVVTVKLWTADCPPAS
jgi:hypothetical protein